MSQSFTMFSKCAFHVGNSPGYIWRQPNFQTLLHWCVFITITSFSISCRTSNLWILLLPVLIPTCFLFCIWCSETHVVNVEGINVTKTNIIKFLELREKINSSVFFVSSLLNVKMSAPTGTPYPHIFTPLITKTGLLGNKPRPADESKSLFAIVHCNFADLMSAQPIQFFYRSCQLIITSLSGWVRVHVAPYHCLQ